MVRTRNSKPSGRENRELMTTNQNMVYTLKEEQRFQEL
jgi:hypothetical protein